VPLRSYGESPNADFARRTRSQRCSLPQPLASRVTSQQGRVPPPGGDGARGAARCRIPGGPWCHARGHRRSIRRPRPPRRGSRRRRSTSAWAADPPSLWCGLSGTRRSVPALLVGLALVLLLPHPWNRVGLAAAIIWEIVAILYSLRWSKRQPPLVGTDTLVGRGAVVVMPCAPWGRVRLQGETWRARSEVAAAPGARVRIRSVEGLTLHVEPEQAR
jgi:membrane protein implicated in regulation of membrane protease activity